VDSINNHTPVIIMHACSWYEGDGSDEEDVFKPSKGNVLFCSAIDGWGFTVPQFARMYAQKFGFREKALSRALWGPYVLKPKDRCILHISKAGSKAKPMFVSLVLCPLWSAYEAANEWADAKEILGKIVRSQGLTVPEKAISTPGKSSVKV
jgi:ribosome assembly protein 1